MMTIEQYISSINSRFRLGNATEHTFRGDLQQLIETLVPQFRATNEPKRQACGAPDYIITKKEIPIGYIEAKDIGDNDLDGQKKNGNKEQFDRYKSSLENIIFTDYLDFHWYKDAEIVMKVSVGRIEGNKIIPLRENFQSFELLLKAFCSYTGQTIKSPRKLAEMMAGKARMLANVIEKALNSDDDNQENSSLKDQFLAFRQILIHDIHTKGFADVYAQTIAYGMFAARLHDPSLETFSRQEAAELIPKTNPFLRKLFQYVAGYDLDSRISWIVDGLADVFRATDVAALLKNFGVSTQTQDPIIHFYETFLTAYDPALRKARGVWYTPHPVVNFIVRAIDDILKSEFGIAAGIADNSMTTVKVNVPGIKNPDEKQVHRVQFLDPATGTATFIAEIIKQVYAKFKGQEGIWSDYVEKHLIPRLNGFEILMASYAMAHLKLDLLLRETGYVAKNEQRFRIYLTNSLEEFHADTGTLFANWLSTEANEANHVKRDTPVMVVTGNPPYSGESANKGEWIMKLMEDYKKEPGGKEKLNERNPKWINDDYVKFIRYGQHFIEKNGEGILAFINPHGFLDNPTFRGMRWNLLKTFDKIYTIDLHGNSKKKETADDGTIDENVFDIQQGVSINFFIKTGTKKSIELGKVFHFDLFGKREMKYDFLNEKSLYTVSYKEIPNSSPNYFFVVKDFEQQIEYDKGFQISDLFTVNSVGIVTARDNFTIHNSKDEVKKTIEEFLKLDDETARKRFDLGKDVRDWQVNYARKDLENAYSDKSSFQKISYRPFDLRWTFYTGKSKGFHCYPRYEIMRHLLKNENIGIVVSRQTKMDFWKHCLISKNPTTALFVEIKDSSNFFPLYLYPEPNAQQTIDQPAGRVPNLNMEIVNQIANKLGLTFVPEKNSPPSNGARNSPPSEGCPQGGVAHPGEAHPGVVLTTINTTPIIRNFIENLPYNPALKQRARDKRKAGILSEVLFWQQVHKGMFHKIDFDRQRIIGNYIVDFYVKTLGLVVEIDGSSHDNKDEYDRIRQQYLESFGLKVYRIADIDVKKNLSWVMTELEKYIVKVYGEPATPVFDHLSGGGECSTPPCGHPSNGGEFAPVDLLDYIYAVLHSPSYREKYKEFLKIDFPRVPYPKDKATFWQLVELGGEIRQIHLLESQVLNNFITKYPVGGSNEVGKVRFEISENETQNSGDSTFGKVWINDEQYFANVPQVAWEFYIGGYQPAQKWLKDRKGRELQIEDILHYQKIIVALSETNRLMKEIDQIDL